MRERKIFSERAKTKKDDETNKKYFLVYEGEESEVIYFDAVNDLKKEIGINPIIELKPLIRSYSETGWSNPQKILNRVIQNIEECKTNIITYETLINRIIDYLIEEKIITASKAHAKTIWNVLKWYYEISMKKSLTDIVKNIEEACENICECLKKEMNVNNIMNDISEIIKNEKITYEEGFDKICLIVDRDKNSFVANPKNNQFKYVMDTCKQKNFGFYLTNPCFEFWLLLHFEEVFGLDRDKLIENKKETSKRTYSEIELRKIFPKYKKASYDAHVLVKSIDKAIENEKRFCDDIEQLECNIGSNLGLLIEEMRK